MVRRAQGIVAAVRLAGDRSHLPFVALYSLRSHVLRHPLVSLLTALATAASVALATALERSARSVSLELDRTSAAISGDSTFQVWASQGVPEGLVETLEAIPGVAGVTPLIRWSVRISRREFDLTLHVLGIDFTAVRKLRSYSISDGRIEIRDPLRLLAGPNSVVLSQEFLDRSGIELGETFQVLWAGVPRELIAEGVLLPGGVADAYGGQLAAMDIYALQELLGRRGWVDRIDLVAAPGVDLDRLRVEISDAVGGLGAVELAGSPDELVARALGTLRTAVGFFAALGIVVAVLLAYTTISHAVDRRTTSFALLQSLGLEPERVRRIVWADTAIIGTLGTALGTAAGRFVAGWLLSSYSRLSELMVDVEARDLSPGYTTLAVGVGVGVLVSLIACMGPARRATAGAPLDVLHSRSPGSPLVGERPGTAWPARASP